MRQMKMIMSRDTLHGRHRLSHQQIDHLLGEQRHDLAYPEKLRNFQLLAHFLEIAAMFRNAGIWFLSLKGPLLSQKIYSDASFRSIFDFDFLLHRSDIDMAVNTLTDQGFFAYEWPCDDHRAIAKLLKYKNQVVLRHASTGVLVELHWRLLTLPVLPEKELDELVLGNLAEIEFGGHVFVTLNQEIEMLYLVLHGGSHNWFRLKWIEDIRQISGRGVYNRERFGDLVAAMRAQRMVGLCNAVMAAVYGDAVPLPFAGNPLRRAEKYAISRIQAGTDATYESLPELISYVMCLLGAFPGSGYKLRMLGLILFRFRRKYGVG